MKLSTTSSVHAQQGIVMCVYGQSGAGKTHQIRTLPSPFIISIEGGLLSLADVEIPCAKVNSIKELRDVYSWILHSEEAKDFDSIAIDSLSEIAEVVLSSEKAGVIDARQAYGAMADQMTAIIRTFRDIPGRNIYFSAKLEKQQDEQGRILYYPSMPGNKIAQGLPYFFDEVLALRVERDQEGNLHRMLMCDTDGLWLAKDRSGKLDPWEPADLGAIIKKIKGEIDE